MLDNTEHMVFAIQFNLCKKSAIFNIKLRYQPIRIDQTPTTPPNPDHTHTMYYLAIFFSWEEVCNIENLLFYKHFAICII